MKVKGDERDVWVLDQWVARVALFTEAVAQADDAYKVPGRQINYVNRKPIGVAGLITPRSPLHRSR